MTDTTDNMQAVIDAARLGEQPTRLDLGEFYAVRRGDGEGIDTIDLTGDEYRDFPRRTTGTVYVENVASFATYYAKHADTGTEVFADESRRTITAVLDAPDPGGETSTGDDGARWRQHLLVFKPPFTDAWTTWTGLDRKLQSQTDFAEFIEDNLSDIASTPVPAADMLAVATTFQRNDKVQFSSTTILESGERRLRYEETTDATAGAKGEIKVPAKFRIGVAIFDDVDPYAVECRFRHRVRSGQLTMAYVMDRPDDKVRDAFRLLTGMLAEQTGATVMRGIGYGAR